MRRWSWFVCAIVETISIELNCTVWLCVVSVWRCSMLEMCAYSGMDEKAKKKKSFFELFFLFNRRRRRRYYSLAPNNCSCFSSFFLFDIPRNISSNSSSRPIVDCTRTHRPSTTREKIERDRNHDGLIATNSPLILQPFTRNAAGKGRWVGRKGVECLSSASVEFRTVARLWKLPYYPSLGLA
ncbi:hypothetical protein ASPBRDRAFT_477093 [Aspergillus brasiliensis CBS 101740]|uniref:Uncharacterized protein n=1 Tax=Aspergillus brasiliensis (strain CBS 101740 / IMI 381727 / IBT 21946) TaxID=767769 RepID=A0A1L9UTU2_ASPBC|nr:hypothetical protein ASPBRDRAFT_477093 [Aspergillus brasiliensis CBS 101740]